MNGVPFITAPTKQQNQMFTDQDKPLSDLEYFLKSQAEKAGDGSKNDISHY